MKTLNKAVARYNGISLIVRILIGLIIGAVLALVAPGAGWVGELGSLFVGALKGIAPVLVFVIVASALAQGSSKLDRRFGTVIWLYMLTTFLAAAIAVVTSFMFPVTVVLADAAQSDVVPQGLGEVMGTLLTNFVANPVSAIMSGNYIGILFWACMFGVAMKKIGSDTTKTFMANTADAVSQIVRWIINLAPFGIMGLVYTNVSGNGLAIVAARSYGAQDEDLLKRTVVGSVVIGLIASLVITTAGFFGLHALLQLLDTPAEILEDAYSYIIVIDLGVVVMFMYNLCAGLLRAIGNSVMPLVFLLISSVLNVGLDLWFIAGVGMGVRGAAVATVIAQGISVVLCVLYVLARVCILIPEKKHFAVGSHLYWELFSQSISMGLMSSIVSAGSVVLQYGINGLGTLTIAGHTAARKLFAFTDMPLISMANAGSTFVSQNRGANQPDRVRRGMRQMYLYSVVVMVAAVVLMSFGAEWMVQLISGSSEPIVLENGARYLLWNAPFYAVLGVLLCTRYALQSLGQKVLPLFSSVIELVGKVIFVLVFIPKFQYNAVILCEPIIWCFMAAYLVAVYLHEPFVFPKK